MARANGPIGHDIVAAHFSIYTPTDIQALSVCEIHNSVAFDELRRPSDGGLYDPKMGPLENLETCTTCGLTYTQCPGHMGHIALTVPVYHPMLFPTLMTIMQRKCFVCNHFRMSKERVNRYVQLLTLLADGKLVEAVELVDAGISCALIAAENSKHSDELDVELRELREQYLDGLLEVANEAMTKLREGRSDGNAISSHVLEFRREITDAFVKRCNTNKCENCGAHATRLRREGSRKIFQLPMSGRNQKAMDAHGLKLHSVLGRAAEGQEEADVAEEAEEVVEDEDDEYEPTESDAKYLTALEVEKHMQLLWSNETDIINLIWGVGFQRPIGTVSQSSPGMFFYRVVPVPPSRFRPYQVTGEQLTEHSQSTYLTKVLNANHAIMQHAMPPEGSDSPPNFSKAIEQWIELQDSVNCFIDSTKTVNAPVNTIPPPGIRQVLEKKEGVFRKHMMGKRVNFAARSVISPDVNIETNEIGVPLYFAKALSFTEPVTPYNEKLLREAVINGPDIYPGANFIIDDKGQTISLASRSKDQRIALSRTLQKSVDLDGGGTEQPKKVGRHLKDGDMMLSNRQPTLHKPGILAHKARVMMTEKTIRMHYANCSSFNADFDGDEMNLHLPQSLHARAEAVVIAAADEQYVVPKDGSPLRGLIQDHVISGVTMTSLNCFLDKGQFMQLLYSAFPSATEAFNIPAPTILKPKQLWTGKQVITAVLTFLTRGLTPLNMERNCKVKGSLWAPHVEEGRVIIQSGELLTGVLGKCQFGASEFGLVHCCYEIYSPAIAGRLLSAFGRLFTYFLQQVGFTCGIQDLLITQDAEAKRRELMQEAIAIGDKVSAELVGVEVGAPSLRALLNRHLRDPANEEDLDRKMMTALNPIHRKIVDVCLPAGQLIHFPRNKFQLMHTTGAKGGIVNHSQISALLGQQALEGRRVPRMISGKTLPCYEPYDPAPIAGGFIAHRFLTGLKPQEYFFHCMAGREGLVDTAVKTSRSGYLQRCLIKHLEGLSVRYDGTVRDSDNSIVQFRYGEDGIDVSKTGFLYNFGFFAQNINCLVKQLQEDCEIQADELVRALKRLKARREEVAAWRAKHPPITSKQNPGTTVGCMSERFEDALEKYIAENPDKLLTSKQSSSKKIPTDLFRALMMVKWIRAAAQPGENVGLLASQSIGEPSTQMTLNTFHHAGQSDFNVTMGIPRLREVTMTASKKIKTPWLKMPVNSSITKEQAEDMCRKFYRLRLVELMENVTVEDTLYVPERYGEDRMRQYRVRIFIRLSEKHTEVYGLTSDKLQEQVENQLVPKLVLQLAKELQKAGESTKNAGSAIVRRAKAAADKSGPEEEAEQAPAPKAAKKNQEDADSDDDGPDDEDDGDGGAGVAAQKAKKGQMASYADDSDEDDVDEEGDKIVRAAEADGADAEDAAPAPAAKMSSKKASKSKASRRSRLLQLDFLHDFCHGENDGVLWSEFTLHVPPSKRKLLIPNLVQAAANNVVLSSVKGIQRAGVTEAKSDGQLFIQTDGVNFDAAWERQDIIDVNKIESNDVWAVLNTYGVEAARTVIQNEIRAVFGAYGITSDLRHLGLLADYMTFAGAFRPLNRQGIEANTSPFLKMSFETTTHFLESAAIFGDVDQMRNPSACIVMGKPVQTGTGSFDVIQPLKFDSQ